MRRCSMMLLAALLAGCDHAAAPKGTAGPDFDPVVFFTGHVRSYGVMEDRDGAPTLTVRTDCRGSVDADGRLHMTQHLAFGDGTTQDRMWTMWPDGPGRFAATANDMAGTATGDAHPGLFHWRWTLARQPVDVTMEQWMYALPDGSVMIRTTIGRFGIILREVSEQFVRAPLSPA